jgi:N-acetylmuramoyl-L-alanine amidase
VDVAVRHPRTQRIFLAWALATAVAGAPAGADAAVVRGIRVERSTTATRFVVDVDGPVSFRTAASEGGGTMQVDLDASSLGPSVPRLLPVSDRRVDGVLLLEDPEAGVVRVSVDLAGRVAPHVEVRLEGSRLLLDVVDRQAVGGNAEQAATRETQAAAVETRGESGGGRAPVLSAPVPDARELRLAKLRAEARSREQSAGERLLSSRLPSGSAGSPSSASPSRRSVVQKPVVVLDPGHGGKDPGARAWTGEMEKDIVLDLAERVARRLRARGDVEVVMTRSGDEFVELADRRDASRRWGADAFVSIHANASHNAAARGFETYYHSRSSGDRDMRRLARAENGGRALRGGAAPKAGISRTSVRSSGAPLVDRRAESIRLARLVQGELVRHLGMRYEAVRDLGAKEGPFFVIGDNAAPSVLVEAAFLTHREEGLRMRSEVYREQIADGVARGIALFLEQQRRSGTL